MVELKNLEPLVVTFDARVYSVIAVKKAAYRYVKDFAADISIAGDQITCVLLSAPPVIGPDLAAAANDFRKEVLDQDLRERLKAETESVRNLILAHAFSRSGLVVEDEQVSKD